MKRVWKRALRYRSPLITVPPDRRARSHIASSRHRVKIIASLSPSFAISCTYIYDSSIVVIIISVKTLHMKKSHRYYVYML